MLNQKGSQPAVPRRDLQAVKAVFLDSQPISNGAGFRLSAAVEELLELAQALKVDVVVPEAVLVELQIQFQRELEKAIKDASEACQRAARVQRGRYEAPPVDIPAAVSRHAQEIVEFRKRFGVQVIPFTTRNNEELFRMAANRKRPFREASKTVTDAGFKDSVIYLSVVDDLRAKARPAALVSLDTDYVGAEALLERGMFLLQATVSEMVEELRRRLNVKALEAADQRRRLADANLHANGEQLQGLEKFAVDHFTIPDLLDLPFWVPRPRQVSAKRVMKTEVRNLTPAMHDVERGSQVRLTINVLMHVNLVVGASSSRSVLPPDIVVAENDSVLTSSLNVVAVMEATAIRTPDGYSDFQPVSLNVPTGWLSATKHQKRDADAWIRELREQGILDE
jgi:PIN domain